MEKDGLTGWVQPFTSTGDILVNADIDGILIKLALALDPFIRVDGLSVKIAGVAEELLLLRVPEGYDKQVVFASGVLDENGFAGRVMAGDGPVVIDDIASEALSFPQYVRRERFRSLVGVPLTSGRRRIGMLTLYMRKLCDVRDSLIPVVSLVAGVAATIVENSQLLKRLEKNYFSTVEALAAAIEAKDPYTRGHSKRVTQYAIVLAERLNVSGGTMKDLQYGSMLHDIGKIGVRGQILNKRGRLTPEEYKIIKRHPIIGERIIDRVDFLQGAKPVVRSHHERFDGTGYPDGLRDEEIPLLARIVAVVDFFDALTSERPYRPAFSPEQTRLFIKEGIGSDFDPLIAKEFLEIAGATPRPEEVPVEVGPAPEL
jgi:HD-GYP domain-containing protein (c-di-GMP phosphodiesterase class II)